jgi:hypothetical protein
MAGPWEQYAQQEAPQQQAPTAPAWAANLSQKDQAEITMKMHQEGRKRLAELQAQISDASSTMNDLNEFGRLNRENSTGSLWQQLTPDKQMFRSDGSMQMSAIQSRLAPQQRPVGSGATSDRDISLYLKALPNIENTGPVNKGIREDFEANYNRAIEKANAMKAHLDQYGNLSDFDSQWAQRKTAKPMLNVPSPSANIHAQADAILKGK